MPRPLPDYIPGSIRDIVSQRWPSTGLKGLAKSAGVEYGMLRNFFQHSRQNSLLLFKKFCVALGLEMDKALPLLREEGYRTKLRKLIDSQYGGIQPFCRATGLGDGYIESVLRGDTGQR